VGILAFIASVVSFWLMGSMVIDVKIKIKVNSFNYLAWFLGECRSDNDLYQFDRLQAYYHIAGYTRPILDHVTSTIV